MPSILSGQQITSLPMVADAEKIRELLHDVSAASENLTDRDVAAWVRDAVNEPQIGDLLGPVFAVSPFLHRCAISELGFLKRMFEVGPETALIGVFDEIKDELSHETEAARLMTRLRILRRRVALLVALADVFGMWPLERITHVLSQFADGAVSTTISHLLRLAAAKGDVTLWDEYFPEDNCGFFMLAMGKYGARELNYSSDIDLIAIFDPEKVRDTGKSYPPKIFTNLVRQLIYILQDQTKEGYVFRVDLRLRPDPSATPIAMTKASALSYYSSRGAQWERAAMIKARPAAGDLALGRQFVDQLTEFVWRPDIDFWTQQEIGSIKQKINKHKGGSTIKFYGHNVKTGSGGIREIEFFVQTHQLVYAGRDKYLRGRQTLEMLHTLSEAGHVDESVADELTEAYEFLRQLEHRLQMIQDLQTQLLPTDPDEMRHVAAFMGYSDLEAFEAAVLGQFNLVAAHYKRFFGESPAEGTDEGDRKREFEAKGYEPIDLAELGFSKTGDLMDVLTNWRNGGVPVARDERCGKLFASMIPEVVEYCAESLYPDDAMLHIDRFFKKFPARIREISLLRSNPDLLHLMIRLATKSPALIDVLCRQPEVLQSAVTRRYFGAFPDRRILFAEVDKRVPRADEQDESLSRIGQWAEELRFQVKLGVALGDLGAGEAGRCTSDLSDALIGTVANRLCERRVGLKPISQHRFAVLAMGALGRREQLPGADAELLFVHDEDAETAAELTEACRELVKVLNTPCPRVALCRVFTGRTAYAPYGPVFSSLDSFLDHCTAHETLEPSVALLDARVMIAGGEFERDIRLAISSQLARVDMADERLESHLRFITSPGHGADTSQMPLRGRIDRVLARLNPLINTARLVAPGEPVGPDALGGDHGACLVAAGIARDEAHAREIMSIRESVFGLQYLHEVTLAGQDITQDWTDETRAAFGDLIGVEPREGIGDALASFEDRVEDAARHILNRTA